MACDFHREHALRARGFFCIAGVDEAGRGPLAGPVVAAAVILPENYPTGELNDSKKLSPPRREKLFEELTNDPLVRWSAAEATVEEIDTINILRATHLAMGRALSQLVPTPDHALVDGLPVPGLPVPHTAVVDGDALSLSIAAASIMAKVLRDRRMREIDTAYPEYGFCRHKGYGVREHLAALRNHGPTPHHRRSFSPVAQTLQKTEG
jgi:ribonuclease HII